MGFSSRRVKMLRRAVVMICFMVNGAITTGQNTEDSGRVEIGREASSKLLETIALQMRSNFERIETWSGTCSFSDWVRSNDPNPSFGADGLIREGVRVIAEPVTVPEVIAKHEGPKPGYWRLMRGTITFSLDNINGRLHTFVDSSDPVIFVDVANGTQMTTGKPGFGRHLIVNPEEMFEYDVRENRGQIPGFTSLPWLPASGSRVLFRRASENSRRDTQSFDPRDCFFQGQYSTKKPRSYWSHCERHAGWVVNPKYAEMESIVGSADHAPVYTHTFTSKSGTKTSWKYDGNVSFNVIDDSQFQNGVLSWQRRSKFQAVSEIFVPAEMTVIHTREDEDGTIHPSFIRTITMQKTVLNSPVSDDEFNVGQFRFRYGDRMVDEIKGSLSVYDGAKYVPAEEFVVDDAKLNPAKVVIQDSKQKTDGPKPRGNRWLLIINGLVFLSIIGVCMCRGQRRGSH